LTPSQHQTLVGQVCLGSKDLIVHLPKATLLASTLSGNRSTPCPGVQGRQWKVPEAQEKVAFVNIIALNHCESVVGKPFAEGACELRKDHHRQRRVGPASK
jgi:hypothetical protein